MTIFLDGAYSREVERSFHNLFMVDMILRLELSCFILFSFYFRPFSYHGGSSNDGSALNGMGSFEQINEPVGVPFKP